MENNIHSNIQKEIIKEFLITEEKDILIKPDILEKNNEVDWTQIFEGLSPNPLVESMNQ